MGEQGLEASVGDGAAPERERVNAAGGGRRQVSDQLENVVVGGGASECDGVHAAHVDAVVEAAAGLGVGGAQLPAPRHHHQPRPEARRRVQHVAPQRTHLRTKHTQGLSENGDRPNCSRMLALGGDDCGERGGWVGGVDRDRAWDTECTDFFDERRKVF